MVMDPTPAKNSHPLHKTIHHPLLPGPIELDRQLVAVDGGDDAVAEFLVEDAVAERERGNRAGGFGDQLAFDGERQARPGDALVAGAPGGRRGGVVVAGDAGIPWAPTRSSSAR